MPDERATMLDCPSCGPGTTLVEVDRNGVLIDACPRCRGVWLERGELDKLISLEADAYDRDDFLAEVRGTSGGERQGGDAHGREKRRKRGSFLGEFLDFG